MSRKRDNAIQAAGIEGEGLCACMVSRSRWFKLRQYNQANLAEAVFHNLRCCPYCRLRGRGKWGQFTSEDRARYNFDPVRVGRFGLFAFALRMAVATFCDCMRDHGALSARVRGRN